MFRPLFLLLAIISLFAVGSAGVAVHHPTLDNRDENLPARVPYVFPAPGTDPVSKLVLQPTDNLHTQGVVRSQTPSELVEQTGPC